MEAFVLFTIIFLSVAIHELGHLSAAVITKMKVEKYYVGWGPRLFSRSIRGVEVGVRALPLGGYVKIPGMDLRKADEHPEGTYAKAPWYSQVFVAVGGPVTHWIIAFVLFAIAIAAFSPRFTSSDGPTTWVVAPNSASYEAGFRSGDQLLAFNGTELTSWNEAVETIVAAEGVGTVEVLRDSGSAALITTDSLDPYLGLEFAPESLEPLTFSSVVSGAVESTVATTGAVVSAMADLVSSMPDLISSAKGDSAPSEDRPRSLVGIGEVAGSMSDSFGWYGVLAMAAQINLFLGLFNLLPVYPLDGGHMLAALVNRITSAKPRLRRVSLHGLVYSTPVVVCAMALLFVAAVTTDIRAMIT